MNRLCCSHKKKNVILVHEKKKKKKKKKRESERERNWCTVIGYVKWAKIHFETLFKSAL